LRSFGGLLMRNRFPLCNLSVVFLGCGCFAPTVCAKCPQFKPRAAKNDAAAQKKTPAHLR